MPVISWYIKAITLGDMSCLDPSLLQQRILDIIRGPKFTRAVVVRISFSANVNKFPIMGCYY
jgi:hypothetical protein